MLNDLNVNMIDLMKVKFLTDVRDSNMCISDEVNNNEGQ